ncbi:DUF362 domain-containing protein [bacterium]|nr:DUF362 domain-containing protein [bacterium]
MVPLKNYSRRGFLNTIGAGIAGVYATTSGLLNPLQLFGNNTGSDYSTQVAATLADHYDQTFIKERIAHLFESLGGLSDIMSPGDKVAIKINLTGGSDTAFHENLQGVDIREAAWTHPSVLRAVGELLIDNGISGTDIYIVEAIWDMDSYVNFGYQDVQNYLGAQFVNLNEPAPYADFLNVATGSNYFFYDHFIFNRILDEADTFISIPKMKHHYDAALTHGMKNLVGISPLDHYMMPDQPGWRSKLHFEGGDVGIHLPRAICDLNMARPVHLVVNDGIKNAVGGEGPWNPTFQPAEYGLLLAGKDPVATDSIATYVMGTNPESVEVQRPSGLYADNHLYLAKQKGLGTNLMDEIELVGDGAGSIVGINEYEAVSKLKLYPNYPNPFVISTTIPFYLPKEGMVNIAIINSSGREIKILANKVMPAGQNEITWNAGRMGGGMYYCRINYNGNTQSRTLVLQR